MFVGFKNIVSNKSCVLIHFNENWKVELGSYISGKLTQDMSAGYGI